MLSKEKRYNAFIEYLESQYMELISKPKTKQCYEDRVNFSIFCAENILKGQEMYLYEEKASNQDKIIFDNSVSIYADKFYVVIEGLIQEYIENVNMKNAVGKIDPQKIADLIDSRNDMLYISARWKTIRVMNVFDMDRDFKKQKVPRRFPLLKDPCFCFDRVIETALGITHKDGFNPNRGVLCMPPSSGKTYGANCYTCLMLSHFWVRWQETGLIRMTNNSTNAQAYGSQCVKMMKDERWLRIFPEFRKYINSKGKIDIFQKESVENLLLKDCNSECTDSIFMFGTDAGINGKRAMLGAVLDDLSDGIDDIDNDERHMQITDKVRSDVSDRNDDDDAPIISMGTMYNQYDTQNSFIEEWESEGLKPYKSSNFIRISRDGKKYVCLVDIEDEMGNSIAPDLYTNEKLRGKRNYFINRGKEYVYNLIYRQKKDSREPKTFDLRTLYLYNFNDKCDTLNEYGKTMIDTTRKTGNDFFAAPFFHYNSASERYRVDDAIFEQKSLGLVDDPKNLFAEKLCRAIIKNKTTEVCIENNVSNTTSALLKGLCAQKKYVGCKFRDRYTTKKGKSSTKVTRILDMEETIKNHFEFPDPKTIPVGHPLAQFMRYFTEWNSKEGQKVTNKDDACDVMAMAADEFVFKRRNKGAIKEIRFN